MELELDQDALLDHFDLLLLGGQTLKELRSGVKSLIDASSYPNITRSPL